MAVPSSRLATASAHRAAMTLWQWHNGSFLLSGPAERVRGPFMVAGRTCPAIGNGSIRAALPT
jgi:hypothetical protein